MAYLSFISNNRQLCVLAEDVAFIYPSIVEDGTTFITLTSGKQFRARNIQEMSIWPHQRGHFKQTNQISPDNKVLN
ncbi:hypothetical protein CEQ35_022595 [Yersinia enterocolitica]|nr:hypothetical protein CEQ35_000135 [Yersinia enterocolitica]PNK76621.1 hypothetical protein CEQ35_022595 [Yersinia enterocolitica]